MRVLVSVDMEGIAGIASPDDVTPGKPDYDRNCGYMTDEANAAVRGVLAQEPDASVIVVDGHARFRNLIPHRLDPRCTLIRGGPRAHGMMAGIASGVDLVFFLGYHGRAGTPDSVLAHTMSGATIAQVRCNGQELGELGLNAALAARWGAIPALATGDDTLVREAEALLPGIATLAVKRALGNRAVDGMHPAVVCERIESLAKRAVESPPDVRAPDFGGRVDLEVDVLRPHMTEYARMIPGIQARGPLTLGFDAADFGTAYNLIEVLLVLAAAT